MEGFREETNSILDLEGQTGFELVQGRYRKHFMGKKQKEKRQRCKFSFNKDRLNPYGVAGVCLKLEKLSQMNFLSSSSPRSGGGENVYCSIVTTA